MSGLSGLSNDEFLDALAVVDASDPTVVVNAGTSPRVHNDDVGVLFALGDLDANIHLFWVPIVLATDLVEHLRTAVVRSMETLG